MQRLYIVFSKWSVWVQLWHEVFRKSVIPFSTNSHTKILNWESNSIDMHTKCFFQIRGSLIDIYQPIASSLLHVRGWNLNPCFITFLPLEMNLYSGCLLFFIYFISFISQLVFFPYISLKRYLGCKVVYLFWDINYLKTELRGTRHWAQTSCYCFFLCKSFLFIWWHFFYNVFCLHWPLFCIVS